MRDPGDETNHVEVNAHKMRVEIPVPNELITDQLVGRPSTPEEREAPRREREELRVAGLLDEEGNQIRITDCPACYTVADGTAAGWSGPLGDYVRCERPRGHTGDHIFTVRWDDSIG